MRSGIITVAFVTVAFCNIECEIHGKARQQVTDLIGNNPSKGEDDSHNEDDNQDEARSLVGKSPVFNLSGDIDLELPFLQGMLLDIQISLTPGQGITPTAATNSVCEPTKDNWENM